MIFFEHREPRADQTWWISGTCCWETLQEFLAQYFCKAPDFGSGLQARELKRSQGYWPVNFYLIYKQAWQMMVRVEWFFSSETLIQSVQITHIICVYIYIFICIYIYICICSYLYIYICIYSYLSISTYDIYIYAFQAPGTSSCAPKTWAHRGECSVFSVGFILGAHCGCFGIHFAFGLIGLTVGSWVMWLLGAEVAMAMGVRVASTMTF